MNHSQLRGVLLDRLRKSPDSLEIIHEVDLLISNHKALVRLAERHDEEATCPMFSTALAKSRRFFVNRPEAVPKGGK